MIANVLAAFRSRFVSIVSFRDFELCKDTHSERKRERKEKMKNIRKEYVKMKH